MHVHTYTPTVCIYRNTMESICCTQFRNVPSKLYNSDMWEINVALEVPRSFLSLLHKYVCSTCSAIQISTKLILESRVKCLKCFVVFSGPGTLLSGQILILSVFGWWAWRCPFANRRREKGVWWGATGHYAASVSDWAGCSYEDDSQKTVSRSVN